MQHQQAIQLQQVTRVVFVALPPQLCPCSVGDDGLLRLWDRRASEPLQTHVAHDNWYVATPPFLRMVHPFSVCV